MREQLKKCICIMDLFRKNGSASRAEITNHLLRYFPADGPLPRTTFVRYKDFIEENFSCKLEYDKMTEQYHIRHIRSANPLDESVADYLFSMYKVLDAAPLIMKYMDKIHHAEIVTGVENITIVLEAIDQHRGLHCTYRSFVNGTTKTRTIIPCFLSTWEGRWYLIAEPTTHPGSQVVYALERMTDITLTDEELLPSVTCSKEEYFKDCYGIQHSTPDSQPLDIVLLAQGAEVEYLRARPIHSSQKELSLEEAQLLCQSSSPQSSSVQKALKSLPLCRGSKERVFFQFRLVPCYNFYQQLLFRREAIEIISPPELRAEVARIAKAISDKYEIE